MTSLRERFDLVCHAPARAQKVDASLTQAASVLKTRLETHLEDTARRQPLQGVMGLAHPETIFDGHPVIIAASLSPLLFPVVGVVQVTAQELRAAEGYKKLHAAAADPEIDMALEIVPRSRLTGGIFSDKAFADTEQFVVVILDRPYRDSTDAGVHLKDQKALIPVKALLPTR